MTNPGNSGFLVLPRRLLELYFASRRGSGMGEVEAYLYLLCTACYKDQGGGPSGLRRGELACSVRTLAAELGWSRTHVSRFIRTLEERGLAEVVRLAQGTHLRLTCYDRLCRLRRCQSGGGEANLCDALFDEFWRQYHELSQQPPVDIAEARKAWSRLGPLERQEAVRNIPAYLCLLPGMDRARTAAGYLLKKSFILN